MLMSDVFEGNDIAFVFVDSVNDLIVTYRDIFGKRSLILTYDSQYGEVLLSSVALSN